MMPLLLALALHSHPDYLAATWLSRGLKHPLAMTTESNVHPKGTKLRLRVSPAHPWVYVRVRGYGPQPWTGKSLDVSLGVARKLGMVKAGVAVLEVDLDADGIQGDVGLDAARENT